MTSRPTQNNSVIPTGAIASLREDVAKWMDRLFRVSHQGMPSGMPDRAERSGALAPEGIRTNA
jgi:hypothetical protein